jgi:hypothetical protein
MMTTMLGRPAAQAGPLARATELEIPVINAWLRVRPIRSSSLSAISRVIALA